MPRDTTNIYADVKRTTIMILWVEANILNKHLLDITSSEKIKIKIIIKLKLK